MKSTLFIFTLSLFLSFSASAQKVAVVLSGGGSKGTAHIGVLKALEENHIPIDYIAGTSIGAIIGGLYASGWTIEQMEQLVISDDFNRLASGVVDEKYVYYFKKPEADASWASFRFNIDSIWEFNVPTNLVSSSQMDFMFMDIFSQSNALCKGNFDSLFVPFRCVGSNITQSRADVFRSGNLVQSVRASMTYPLYFKPIIINGNMYMDGGMYNNFPADIALNDFDPDIIIGVKVVSGNTTPDPDNLMSQLESIFMAETDYSLPCNSSVLIEPILPATNIIDFSKASLFIDLGYKAAMEKIPEIRMFVTDSVSPEEVQLRRNAFNVRKSPLIFNDVQVEGLEKNQKDYVVSYYNRKDSLKDKELVKRSYYQLMADDKIRSMYPLSVFNDSTGYYSLNLNVKKESNFVLRFGGVVSSNPMNEAFAEIEYLYLNKRALTLTANTYIGRFYSSGKVAGRLDFPGKHHYALFGRIIYNQWDFFKTSTRFFEDKNPSYLIENDYHWDLGMIIPARNKGKISFGATALIFNDEYFQNNYFSRTDLPDRTYFRALSPFIQWERNTLNKKQFANSGTLLNIKAAYVEGNENTQPGSTSIISEIYEAKHRFFYATFIYENYFKRVGRFKFGWYNDIYWSNEDFFGNYTASMLFTHGFNPVPEMRALFMPQFRAHAYAGSGLKTIFQFRENFDFRVEGYIFQPYQEIKSGPSGIYPEYGPELSQRYYIASSSLVFHSPLGPVLFSLSYYDQYDDPWLFSFYLGYMLFNQKAIN
ncbi:MAG: patatin-like phospholipase family protein [Bacteroidales bacterium]|nr:patatin-like phospholipase family protein [Bacteroidales bacterium]